MDAKTSRCTRMSCRKTCFKICHCLNLLFIVSCLERTLFIMCSLSSGIVTHAGHFTRSGASPTYPSSASTLSNGSKYVTREARKISRSLYSPGWYGPLIQQISPPTIDRPTSYLRPDFLNLKEYHSRPRSGIWKSVPSTLSKQSLYWSFLYLLSNKI